MYCFLTTCCCGRREFQLQQCTLCLFFSPHVDRNWINKEKHNDFPCFILVGYLILFAVLVLVNISVSGEVVGPVTLPSKCSFSMLTIKPAKTKGADGARGFQAVLEPMTTQPHFDHNDVLCPSWDLDSVLCIASL